MKREIVGLAGLAVAIAVSLPSVFLRDDRGSGGPVPTATVAPTFTQSASPIPASTPPSSPALIPERGALEAPNAWAVTFYRELNDRRIQNEPVSLPELALEFDGAPFGEYPDGEWGLLAVTDWRDLPPGRYELVLEFDCELLVLQDGKKLARAKDPTGVTKLELTVIHLGGELSITLEAMDSEGPFILRWR
ncbi:MAG TPA: hypothetical protein QGF35_00485 [Dehalococcoidia bacterium]|nr:hypothetical protein [Dehalococcoidia bacterium]